MVQHLELVVALKEREGSEYELLVQGPPNVDWRRKNMSYWMMLELPDSDEPSDLCGKTIA